MSGRPSTSAGKLMLTAIRRAQPDWTGASDYIAAIEDEAARLSVETMTRAMERAMAAVDDEWTIPECGPHCCRVHRLRRPQAPEVGR